MGQILKQEPDHIEINLNEEVKSEKNDCVEERCETAETTSLENNFLKIEEILNVLEEEDTTLEESFRYYQKGMDLLKQCNTEIDYVEKKVLKLQENGEVHEF